MLATGKRLVLVYSILIVIAAVIVLGFREALLSPPNALWALFSGYYRYDPRQQSPPHELFSDRPEQSLKYFFDATLKLCGGKYPPLSQSTVTRYEVEEVEYFGHTDYHAFSDLHTRVYFADGTSVRAVFRFEAGHNEAYPLLLIDTSTIEAGAWMSLGSFVRDPDVPPPGWAQYLESARPFKCTPGPPYAIEESQ
jgi:hypothetical protein